MIVGGGVIGLASAWELARGGVSVTLLERGEVGRESSWAGGGILSALPPWDYPEPVDGLIRLSCRLYPEWVGEIAALSGVDPEYRPSGMLVLPGFDADKALAWSAKSGAVVARIAARDRLPGLAEDSEALWLPEVAQVRNPRLIKALRRALELRGVRIVERAEVTGLKVSGRAVTGLFTTGGRFSAACYLVAGGAWSAAVLGRHALGLDIRPIRGQMLLYRARPGLLSHIVLQQGFYLIPRADGHILAGSTLEEAGFERNTTAAARDALHRRAVALLPALRDVEIERQWAGLRPGSPGNVPTIARHPRIENLYLNTGHFRYGVTMAPASALLAANRIWGREQPIMVSPYEWPVLGVA